MSHLTHTLQGKDSNTLQKEVNGRVGEKLFMTMDITKVETAQ